jgi:hypothetical protein
MGPQPAYVLGGQPHDPDAPTGVTRNDRSCRCPRSDLPPMSVRARRWVASGSMLNRSQDHEQHREYEKRDPGPPSGARVA